MTLRSSWCFGKLTLHAETLHRDNDSIASRHQCDRHGEAFIIPWLHLTEADSIAYRFGMPAFLYLQRGDPVRMVITG